MNVDAWKRQGRSVEYAGPIFTIHKERVLSPVSGREQSFDTLESPDWVNVVALTTTGNVVLIRQYRIGTNTITTEIPGGTIDPGETPLEAARRELAEETGYVSDHWEELGRVEPNPAFQSNTTHTFLARHAWRAGEQTPDENEDIEVEEYPLDQVPGLLANRTITHALVVCAFFYLALRGEIGLQAGRNS